MVARIFRKWHIFMSVMLVASLFAMPVSAGIGGSSQAGIQVQNLSTSSNTVVVTFYPQGGGPNFPLEGIAVAPESAKNYYVPDLSQLNDSAYAVVVSAEREAAGIAKTDWSSTGGAAIYSTSPPATSVLVPLVLNNFASQTSQVSVQNTNTASDGNISDVTLTLFARGSGTPVQTLSNQVIERGTSKTWSLSDPVWGNLPDNGADFLVNTGFVGSLLIESASTELAVQSFIDIAGTKGVTGFSGVSSTSASNTLYCPLARDNYYGNTGISMVNSNASPANVTITFRSDPASPNQGTFTQNMTIAANSSDIAFQGPGGNSRDAGVPGGTQTGGSSALTNDGFFGSATISSDQPIVAVVNDTEFGSGFAVLGQSTYNCVPSSGAGRTHYLPLLRNGHVASNRLTTGVQILNVTGDAGNASLNLVSWDGTDAPDPAGQNLTANGAANFYGGFWSGLPTVPANLGGFGWFGSGVVTCSVDCVVLVSDESAPGAPTAVDRANYIGIRN